jgi:Galactose-3-O-sulfotransferase
MAHMMFGLHEHVPRPATYITLFRHPVARVLSGYKNVRRHREHRFHDMVVSRDMSLADYVGSGVALELDNSLVRALLGDIETPFGSCTADMLERAKAVIDGHFAVVGMSERLDESLALLDRAFGWRNMFYVSTNVSPVRLSREDQPPATIAAIEELNRFDLELYAYADERMRAQVEACEGFARDLDRFRRGNRLYRRWADMTYTWPRSLRRR